MSYQLDLKAIRLIDQIKSIELAMIIDAYRDSSVSPAVCEKFARLIVRLKLL